MIKRTALAAGVLAMAGGFSPVAADVGNWADGVRASARLISTGVDEKGHLRAGIEIQLPPGWKTYWRYPGDAGIAPMIDFSGSRNIGEAEVTFPTPHRYDDGYAVSNVYEDRLVLPVSAPVLDTDEHVHVSVELHLGVCEQVCIPESVRLELNVPPEGEGLEGRRRAYARRVMDEAHSAMPSAPVPGVFSVVDVLRTGGPDKRPVFTVSAHVPDPDKADIFVAGPKGWYPDIPKYIGQKNGAALYRVEFSRAGAETPIQDAKLHMVIVSGDHAIRQSVSLD